MQLKQLLEIIRKKITIGLIKKDAEQYFNSKLKIKNYEIKFKETGAIPLFHPKNIKKINQMEIGTAGGMTRLSTGYTFMNIQSQSKYIRAVSYTHLTLPTKRIV